MSISIQNLSGHPQPFLYSPQHLKYLLDVNEGIWAVCTGHVDIKPFLANYCHT